MRTISLVALALSTALAAPLDAQYPSYPAVQPVSPADQLASVMRRLAAAPTDLQALISAGELSAKLDDMSAAAAFFARADKIDPRNGRVKAGMASILVRAERPGEALRYFQMAESYGLPASRYAADRGLAFDLVGEQERAQRDYRLALRTTPDDETVRRYALSLGISGKQQMALDQLEPLVRRQDRAAWRVRAFVLAMNGDVPGANKIATSVMPAGMAVGLRPFFERLPALPASDRAFAVHFGEVRPTPARLADARMKPVLAALGPDPYAPVQVAMAQTPPPLVSTSRGRARDDRRTSRRERIQLASTRIRSDTAPTRSVAPASSSVAPVSGSSVALARATPAPVVRQQTYASLPGRVATGPAAPASTGPVRGLAAAMATPPVATVPSSGGTVTMPQRPTAPPASMAVAAATPTPIPSAIAPRPSFTSSSPTNGSAPGAPPVVLAAQPAPSTIGAAGSAQLTSAVPAPAAATTTPVQVASLSTTPPVIGSGAVPSAAPVTGPASPIPTLAPVQAAAASTGAAPGFTTIGPAVSTEAPAALAGAVSPAAAQVTAVRSEDSILARIVASITIPGEELGVAEPVRPAVAVAKVDPITERTLAVGKARAARETADRTAAARTIAAAAKAKPVDTRPGTRKGRADAAEAELEMKTGPRGKSSTKGKVELAAKGPVRGNAKANEDAEANSSAKPKTAAEKRLAARKQADEKLGGSKKEVDDKTAAAKKDGTKKDRGERERIWVQVAGGANESDLPKAWSAAQKKAAALKGRQGYSTPLRATNRVVTGPFETEAEARAFVNQLARQGVSAFQFTSGAGQKMTKLPAR